MKQRTCEELGVCQLRAECRVPCLAPSGRQRYPFAPGVIEGSFECEGYNRIEKVGYTLLVPACLGALVAIVGFSTGYFNLPGLLL